jgi:hypothetical protein
MMGTMSVFVVRVVSPDEGVAAIGDAPAIDRDKYGKER